MRLHKLSETLKVIILNRGDFSEQYAWLKLQQIVANELFVEKSVQCAQWTSAVSGFLLKLPFRIC